MFYAFIKDGIVANIAVFAGIDEELATAISQEQGYEGYVATDESPVLGDLWDGKQFVTSPDRLPVDTGTAK